MKQTKKQTVQSEASKKRGRPRKEDTPIISKEKVVRREFRIDLRRLLNLPKDEEITDIDGYDVISVTVSKKED